MSQNKLNHNKKIIKANNNNKLYFLIYYKKLKRMKTATLIKKLKLINILNIFYFKILHRLIITIYLIDNISLSNLFLS